MISNDHHPVFRRNTTKQLCFFVRLSLAPYQLISKLRAQHQTRSGLILQGSPVRAVKKNENAQVVQNDPLKKGYVSIHSAIDSCQILS